MFLIRPVSPVASGKENLGFTHAEGNEVVFQGNGKHRKTVINCSAALSFSASSALMRMQVKCLSSADAASAAQFIAKAGLKLPVSGQEETLCFRCMGH
jgi:hypothetical protein